MKDPDDPWGPLTDQDRAPAQKMGSYALVSRLELLPLGARARGAGLPVEWRALMAEVCRRLDPPQREVGELFKEPIFYGDLSCVEASQRVRAQLTEAEHITSGAQQPRMSTEHPATAEEAEYEAGLLVRRDELLRSVVTALGGAHLLR